MKRKTFIASLFAPFLVKGAEPKVPLEADVLFVNCDITTVDGWKNGMAAMSHVLNAHIRESGKNIMAISLGEFKIQEQMGICAKVIMDNPPLNKPTI